MKTALLSISLFFLFIVACIAALPMVLSSAWGEQKFLSWINRKIPGKLTIEEISLSWLNPQKITEISLVDEQDVPLFHCESVAIDAPLWKILFRQNLDVMTVSHPQVYLHPSDFTSSDSSSSKLSKLPLLLTGKVIVDNGSLSVEGSGIEPIVFSALSLNLEVNKARTHVLLDLRGLSEQNEIQGQFFLKAAVQPRLATVDLEASMDHFPIKGADQILSLISKEYAGLLLSSVGPSINLHLQAKSSKEIFEVSLNAESQFLNAYIQTQSQNDIVTLKSPAKISFTLTPTLAALAGVPLEAPATGKITIEQFRLPDLQFPEASIQASLLLTGIPELQNMQFQISSNALDKGIAFDLTGQSTGGPVSVNGELFGLFTPAPTLKATASAQNGIHLTVHELVLPKPISLDTLRLKAELQAEALFNLPNLFCTIEAQSLDQIDVQLHSDTLSTTFIGSLKKDPFSLVIKKPLAFDYVVREEFFATYIDQVVLLKPALLKVQLEPLTLPLYNLELSHLKLKGKASADSILLGSIDKKKQVELNSALFHFNLDGKTPMAFGSLSAQALLQGLPAGNIQAEVSLDHSFDLNKAHLTAQVQLQDLSTPVVEVWLSKPLAALVGPTLTLDIGMSKKPDAETLKIKGSSALLSINSAFSYKDGYYELQNPAEMQLSLTKEGYDLIDRWLGKTEGPFSLSTPTTVHFSASRLFIPRNLSWQQLLCSAQLEINNFSLKEKQSQHVTTLKNLKVTLSKSSLKDPLRFNLHGTINPGSITVDGKWDPAYTTLTAKLDQFPSIFLDSMARNFGPANFPFTSLFGQAVNIDLDTQIQNQSGPLSLSIYSPNTRAALKGNISQGTLTLTEPIHAQILMSKELSQWLIQDVNPLSISAIYANNPLTLEIAPHGFSLPLFPFEISRFELPKGRVELGQVTCHNDGNLSITLGLLKSKQLTREKELKLWFAPLDFKIQNGVAHIERTEILVAETFDIALWGKMNFVQDKVSMVLGLTPETLHQAFGIKNLPEHYMLQIPLKGTTSDVKINTGKATAKIAALLAWQQKDIAGGIIGGPAGAIVGELLSNLATLPDKNSPSPPAKHPYPWEENKPPTTEKKTGALKGDEKPLKQLMKLLR